MFYYYEIKLVDDKGKEYSKVIATKKHYNPDTEDDKIVKKAVTLGKLNEDETAYYKEVKEISEDEFKDLLKVENNKEDTNSEDKIDKDNEKEEKSNTTFVDSRELKQLLKITNKPDKEGNNYIVVDNENNEIARFYAKDNKEAINKFRMKYIHKKTENKRKIKEENKMTKDLSKYLKIIENNGFGYNLTEYGDGLYIGIETDTPTGEDWYEEFEWNNDDIKVFIDDLKSRIDNWDSDEEIEPYIEIRGQNGVPTSIRALLDDADWKRDTLQELLDKIEEEYKKENSKTEENKGIKKEDKEMSEEEVIKNVVEDNALYQYIVDMIKSEAESQEVDFKTILNEIIEHGTKNTLVLYNNEIEDICKKYEKEIVVFLNEIETDIGTIEAIQWILPNEPLASIVLGGCDSEILFTIIDYVANEIYNQL